VHYPNRFAGVQSTRTAEWVLLHHHSMTNPLLAGVLFLSSDPCTLAAHPGIEDADAQTSADIICYELEKRGVPAREVRLGKLGGRILVAVDDKRLLINSVEEMPVAAPRLAEAVATGASTEETRKVDNVVGPEARTPKTVSGSVGFKGGIIGAMPATREAGIAPGVAAGILARSGRFGLDGHLRAGGGGGSDVEMTHVVLGSGAQYYFTDGDFAPYLGGGVGLMHYKLERTHSDSVENTGFGLYGEAGVEALRTHHVAFTVGVRADVPTFQLKPESWSPSSTGYYDARGNYQQRPDTEGPPRTRHIVPLSLMVGFLFH
jgi:hypothetical protein